MVAALLAASVAHAETTKWMSGGDALNYAVKLDKRGMIVTNMECKDSNAVGLSVKSALVRLSYKPNTANIDWVFDGWNNLQENVTYWKTRKYHLVQKKVFVRQKSGLRLYCTLYHKD